MMAAALIPLLFIIGLFALFIAGAGSIAGFPELAVITLLIGVAIGVGRTLAQTDGETRAH